MTALRRRALLGAGMLTAGSITTTPTFPQGGAAAVIPPFTLDGPLESLGGFEIDARRLGAANLSGIHLGPGLVATMVDDRARWAQARIHLRDGRAHLLEPIASGPLGDGAGRPLPRGRAGDAEAITRLPDGTWLVAFERWHRIRAYRRLDGHGAYVEGPQGLDRAPANGGLEALTLLADGRLLALTESLTPEGAPTQRRGWIGRPGRWMPIAWEPAEGFSPVDAAGLPDGGALVLERRFSWFGGFAGRLVRVAAADIAAARVGAVLRGVEVLRLDGGALPAENWEGVAAIAHEGRVIVALVADDNDSVLQRSLMLLFALRGAQPGR
ncbi:esterase-like activity of phytase family protein [Roseomonas rubea]|uniref:esterase-like activity of phytase family protein n=1 Tax=Neoroseomonas rubea TaxID=2748666 RepID=UPI0018E019C7|nr:esterase-like activity of phytase family protein [Roseomonas rubea]